MPTETQCRELTANTTYEFTTIDGVEGGKFTAQNGKYVFFPAAGQYYGGEYEDDNCCNYRTSTPSENYNAAAYVFFFHGGGTWVSDTYDYEDGYSVRPVVG